jgi:hypothetical protein
MLWSLSEQELIAQAEHGHYPKWSSMCLLRWLGIETLDAALIVPGTAVVDIEGTLMALALRTRGGRVMLRTDTPHETTNYVRGGNSFVVSDALLCTQKILADRRAVIGLEPTNRFTNRATINIGVDALGHWRSEIIGPGFDASDLQRDGTPPEYICGGLPISTTEFSTMQQLAFCIVPQAHIPMDTRIAARLDNIVRHIFASIGVRPSGSGQLFCRNWLLGQGYTALFRDTIFPFPFVAFRNAFSAVQMLHHYRGARQTGGSFVLSSGVLESGRQIFWDVADSRTKWAPP